MTQGLEIAANLATVCWCPKGKASFPGNTCLKGLEPQGTLFQEAIKHTNGLQMPTYFVFHFSEPESSNAFSIQQCWSQRQANTKLADDYSEE